jgi:hypothetical protein
MAMAASVGVMDAGGDSVLPIVNGSTRGAEAGESQRRRFRFSPRLAPS